MVRKQDHSWIYAVWILVSFENKDNLFRNVLFSGHYILLLTQGNENPSCNKL